MIDRSKHLGKNKTYTAKRTPSRKKKHRLLRQKKSLERNVESVVREMVGEEINFERPIPMTLNDLITTLSGRQNTQTYLVDVGSQVSLDSSVTTDKLLDILEGEDTDECQSLRNSGKFQKTMMTDDHDKRDNNLERNSLNTGYYDSKIDDVQHEKSVGMGSRNGEVTETNHSIGTQEESVFDEQQFMDVDNTYTDDDFQDMMNDLDNESAFSADSDADEDDSINSPEEDYDHYRSPFPGDERGANNDECSQNKIHHHEPSANDNTNASSSSSDLNSPLTDCRRIVDLGYMLRELHAAFDDHSPDDQCLFKHMKMNRTRQRGLITSMWFECSRCQFKKEIYSESAYGDRMELNDAAVAGTLATGTGFSQLEQLLAVMDVPCMAGTTYRYHHEKLNPYLLQAVEQSMIEAGKEERELAIARGDVRCGIPCTKVVTDGTWLKRSYITSAFDSSSGVGIIVGYYTQKVLCFGVRNKYCFICSRAEKLGENPKPHTCYRNWDKSSSSMEQDAILEGFKCSVAQHGLIYSHLIADGDSSVYSSILQWNPYRDYNLQVTKIECYNHLMRNLVNKLKRLFAGMPNLREWKTLIEDNSLRMRNDVMAAVDFRRKELGSEEEKIERLRKDIENVPHHVLGDHSNCARYFCKRAEDKTEVNYVTTMKRLKIFQYVKDAFSRVVSNAKSLIQKMTNNIAETCNSIHAKMVAGKRIHFGLRGSYDARVHLTVLQMNGQDCLQRLVIAMNKKPSSILVRLESNRKSANENRKIRRRMALMFQSEKKTDKKTKKKSTSDKESKASKNKDYGEGCQVPDMDEVEFEKRKEELMQELSSWQMKREQIELETRDRDNGLVEVIDSKVITSQYFGKICRSRASTSCELIVKKILYPSAKDEVLKDYIMTSTAAGLRTLALTEKCKVTESGIFIDPDAPYLAAIPAALVEGLDEEDQNFNEIPPGEEGIVELLCPYNARTMTPEEALERNVGELSKIFSRHFEGVNKNNVVYYQIQGSLHITKKQYCILILWTELGMRWMRIERDDTFWTNKMAQPLKDFYFDCLVPEIIDSRIRRHMKIRNPERILSKMISQQRKSMKMVAPGVLVEPSYYLKNSTMAFVMTRYSCEAVKGLTGKDLMYLRSKEYATLFHGNKWIDGDVIDSFMFANFENWPNVKFVTTGRTSYLLGANADLNNPSSWQMCDFDWNFKGKLFLPYALSGHWCLLVLDVEKKTVLHMNPRQEDDGKYGERALLLFRRFLERYYNDRGDTTGTLSWTVIKDDEKRVSQSDGFNCGMFVMYFMDCIGKHVPFDLQFDPNEYREIIARFLLEKSQAMDETCLNCTQTTNESERITCDCCGRWIHDNCTRFIAVIDGNCNLCRTFFLQ